MNLITTILECHKLTDNYEAKRYLRLALMKLVNEELGIKTNPDYIEFPCGSLTIKAEYPTREEIHIGRSEGKIHAIKVYKDRTGQTLMNAKLTLEHVFKIKGLEFKKF